MTGCSPKTLQMVLERVQHSLVPRLGRTLPKRQVTIKETARSLIALESLQVEFSCLWLYRELFPEKSAFLLK